ncbi:MAG: FMN-binding negative transcriptional regulator [Pseudomonadota bacterium]
MHPNPAFHTAEAEQNLEYARNRAFGVLAVCASDGPLLAHIPFLVSADGKMAELHLVRSNPIVRMLKHPQPAKLAISGPDSYVSPDWYEVDDQVPTWNYIAVHLIGTLYVLPQDRLRDILDRQSALFEEQLAPKPAWTTRKMTPNVMDRMMRSIVPCQLDITSVDGTWKLNQNKSDNARHRAADQVARAGLGAETENLAALMRDA